MVGETGKGKVGCDVAKNNAPLPIFPPLRCEEGRLGSIDGVEQVVVSVVVVVRGTG